jgi:ferredoxin
MLPEAILVLDVLVICHDTEPRTLVVGEIKTYPDRGGYTDPAELGTARAQAGVYVHGLVLVLQELGVSERFRVSREGFLVLTRPGSNRPSVRAGEDLRYQAERAKRGFDLLRSAAASLPTGEGRPNWEDVSRAECHYCEACVSFCDRASVCRSRALEEGRGSVLGDDVERFLGSVTLTRALALLDGAESTSKAEADLARRMQEQEALRNFR